MNRIIFLLGSIILPLGNSNELGTNIRVIVSPKPETILMAILRCGTNG